MSKATKKISLKEIIAITSQMRESKYEFKTCKNCEGEFLCYKKEPLRKFCSVDCRNLAYKRE